MLRTSYLKQGQKYCYLKCYETIRRICTTTSRVGTRKVLNKRRILYVTGASAGSCAALLYLTVNFQEHKDFFNVAKVHQLIPKTEDDISDYCFEVGWEDEWLVFPFFPWGILTRKQHTESNAFNKLSISEIFSPWELSSSDDPWVLLQLTKSHNFWIRQMGIASLAEKALWDGFKYRNVAQACDARTTVGLARYPHANDAFFLPPPKLCTSENDTIMDLQNLVKKMPFPESVNSSIYFFRTQALQKPIRFQKDPITMDFLTQLYTIPGEEQKKDKETLGHCLQALQAYTMEKAYASHFAQLHGLAMLQRIHQEFEDNSIQMYVLTILANLSQVPDLVEDIVRTGWVYELRKWSMGSDTAMAILAQTILANLDRDWITEDVYQDMVLLHPVQRNSQPVYADIVLVHGVRGGAVKTWRQKDSEKKEKSASYSHCWPKDWLATDFQGVRIISVGYDTSLHRWGDYCTHEQSRRTIDGRCQDLMQKLRKAGVGNRPVIWMGHSLGGLLIKQILVNASQEESTLHCFLQQTKGIVMYSVPHKGSGVVDIMMNAKYLLFPSVEVQELVTTSPKLKSLHNKFLVLMTDNPIPYLSFGENQKTDFGRPLPKTVIVPKESSDPGIGTYMSIDANHIESCKPCGKHDPIYKNTKAFLQNILTKIDPSHK